MAAPKEIDHSEVDRMVEEDFQEVDLKEGKEVIQVGVHKKATKVTPAAARRAGGASEA